MSCRAGRMLGASIRYSTTGCGPPTSGWYTQVVIAPSAVCRSTWSIFMPPSLPRAAPRRDARPATSAPAPRPPPAATTGDVLIPRPWVRIQVTHVVESRPRAREQVRSGGRAGDGEGQGQRAGRRCGATSLTGAGAACHRAGCERRRRDRRRRNRRRDDPGVRVAPAGLPHRLVGRVRQRHGRLGAQRRPAGLRVRGDGVRRADRGPLRLPTPRCGPVRPDRRGHRRPHGPAPGAGRHQRPPGAVPGPAAGRQRRPGVARLPRGGRPGPAQPGQQPGQRRPPAPCRR